MKPKTKDRTVRALDVPRLVVQLPDGKEVHHHVVGSEITIGRDATNRISIPDHFVSKFHAKLLVSQTSMTLVDLDSANKTYVNGRQITESPVRFGDQLRFAGVSCRLEAPAIQGKKPAEAAAVTPSSPPAAKVPPVSPPQRQPSTPKPKTPAAAGKARSIPPKVEADPMRRLFVIGGLLIAISLALAIFLRILLVPSETTEETGGESSRSASTPVASPPSAPSAEAPVTAPATTSIVAPVQSGGDRDAEFYFDEALAHLDTGRLKEAQRSFERAVELDPDHARARTRLSLLNEEIEKKAETHFESGSEAFQFLRYDEAIAEWEMFLMLAKEDDPRYAEAQQGIEQASAKLR